MSPHSDLTNVDQNVLDASSRMMDWLMLQALPVWQKGGIDKSTGSFYETVDLESGQGTAAPRRARVQPRQIYCFAEAGRLGWKGPWQSIVERGIEWYLTHYRLENGCFAALVDGDGTRLDETFDLYNHAFALFALVQAGEVLPDRRTELREIAEDLLRTLRKDYAQSERGFREGNPDRLPLRSNPHMHLFEAALAHEEATGDVVWTELSDEIAHLALSRFIDPVTGGLREFFDADWLPIPGDQGRVVEPGHQFEWSWLLLRWGISRGNFEAISKARRLYQIGSTYGIDPERRVAVMALNDDFSMRDPIARLWGQTEWIKAAVGLARISTGVERTAYLTDILRSVDALERYFENVPTGLWHDKLSPDDAFKNEPAPASSFYHIVCAISELADFASETRR